ncbi:vicilin-like seed storage protein At4g36700 isoform X2 [Bidens hawaiensis]|uniref:vicilin-like seed storage protein At4g36700 isoform X2 n=1 Tax=Bidens hawaiensis TaxID=980011 RepID=UPI004049F071
MEPNSLFVPVLLHSDMVFYVKSGSGTLNWVDLQKDKKKLRQVDLRTGDVYRLRPGSFFYLQSNLESERRKFRITAIFSDCKEEMREGSSFRPYSRVGDLLLGFDDKVLQAALNVNEVVLQELRSGGRQQMIVHGVSAANEMFEMHYRSMRAFLGLMGNGLIEVNKNKKGKAFNILEAKHDFENCNGWSLVVTSKQMDALKDSDFGIFLVNLTKGAMMGPHWNPMTAEIAVVLEGSGMVHVVCPSTVDEAECKNLRFRVEEGDVFVVPRYHPMAQISFNNGSFIFLGFTTTQKNNHPQYLVGSASVFQVLDKGVMAASLGVSNTTVDEMTSAQSNLIILECTSCAEEEERLMEEEIQREKAEEAKVREEEEKEREAEEEASRQEEARREQAEAQKRAEEEAKREQEEARKREEEIARREQEEQEARRHQEEEEAAREQEEAEREQEEARKREEEAAKREQEEQEAKRRWEEKEAARQKEAEEREREEARKREEEVARREEEAKRRQEEEEAARQQEEAAERWRHHEEEAATRRRHQEEEAAEEEEQKAERRRQEEEELARQRQEQEEAARRQQEEEAAARRQQEQEAAARRQQEQEAAARKQEETIRRQQEDEAARQQEAARKQQEKEATRQQEEARRQQRRRQEYE